jgi:hypothetical protein
MADPIQVIIEDEDNSTRVDPDTGTIEVDQPGGGVVVHLDAHRPENDDDDEDAFYKNLAIGMSSPTLSGIGNDLHDAITADDESRKQYLEIRRRGLLLTGLKLEEPKATVGDTGSAMEGISSVTNPLLLEACLKGWANARSELLPADGPVKVEVDGTETQAEDGLAEALERGLNHYLTTTAPEYYPDTSHMLLWGTYFGGSGFKKVYRCPMRRRPVSESVDAKDLIVSDTTKDLRACERITNQIPMRKSVMKRMMLLKAYRDIELAKPHPVPGPVETTIANIQGTNPQPKRPDDQEYTLWECQCELDLPEYAPREFKGEGIPLPYIVTIEKDSREVLSIRRDWEEDDTECTRKRMYVKYPYVPGPGFYGTGMLNILGNCSAAMTAAWREALDAGMLASFPGGLIAKLGTRQNTANFRLGPGEFIAVETGGMPISQVVMPLPYKDVTPGLLGMMDRIDAKAKELGGSAEIPTQEGIQNVPVGTMLAQIEQATKVMTAAHKDMHQAQAEEIQLIVELFRKNPEDFWRKNKDQKDFWDDQKFLMALENYRLCPKSDPNIPSHVHRIAKAVALVQLIQMPIFTPLMDPKETLMRVLLAAREDPNGLIIDNPQPQQGDPTQAALAQSKLIAAQAQASKVQVEAAKVQSDAASSKDDAAIKAAELASEQQIQNTRLATEEVIHRNDAQRDAHDAMLAQRAQALKERQHGLDVAKAMHDASMDHREHNLATYEAMNPPTPSSGE